MLALWHRILSRPVGFHANADEKSRSLLLDAVRSSSTHIVAHAAFDSMASALQGTGSLSLGSIGVAVPISGVCWVEWLGTAAQQVGMLCVVSKVRESGLPEQAAFAMFACSDGEPYCINGRVGVFDGDGIFLGVSPAPTPFTPKLEVDPNADQFMAAVAVTIQAFAFAHCKNVGMAHDPLHGPSEKWCRRQKIPSVVYRRLVIPGLTGTRGEPLHGADGEGLRSHIVRGHFKTYTKDSPLFGKYTGKFWHHAHVRGNPDLGCVVKDYVPVPIDGSKERIDGSEQSLSV